MQYRTLGKTNFKVSVVGFGAAPVAFLKEDQDRAADLVNQLLDRGVNLIDTAASYPGSEQFLGQRVGHRRQDFVLVSKCGQRIPESDAPDWSPALITATVDRALRLLRTDHLDVMLLHSCGLDVLERGEALAALVQARDAGKVRFAGYSGDNEAAEYAAGLADVAVIETSINLVDQANIDRVLPLAKRNHIGVIAKRPVANAAWKDLSEQPGMYQSYAKEYTNRLREMNVSPQSLGFRPGASAGAGAGESDAWAEVALRFTLSFPDVHTAIIGTTNPANAVANLRYADAGPLPPEVVDKLRASFARASKGRWSGQT